MKTKTKIIIICGGEGPEHEVSLATAKSVINNLNKKYEYEIIEINKKGDFLKISKNFFLELTSSDNSSSKDIIENFSIINDTPQEIANI